MPHSKTIRVLAGVFLLLFHIANHLLGLGGGAQCQHPLVGLLHVGGGPMLLTTMGMSTPRERSRAPPLGDVRSMREEPCFSTRVMFTPRRRRHAPSGQCPLRAGGVVLLHWGDGRSMREDELCSSTRGISILSGRSHADPSGDVGVVLLHLVGQHDSSSCMERTHQGLPAPCSSTKS